MTLEIIGISVLWMFLFGYVIVASIDFGAGFFNAYNTLTRREHILTNIIERYLSPVWEVTNVFFLCSSSLVSSGSFRKLPSITEQPY